MPILRIKIVFGDWGGLISSIFNGDLLGHQAASLATFRGGGMADPPGSIGATKKLLFGICGTVIMEWQLISCHAGEGGATMMRTIQ